MKTTEKILREEVLQLKELLDCAKKRLEKAPEGGLRIARKENGVEYYCKTQNSGEETGKDGGGGV